jgi:translation elongation factor EF-1beta
VPLLQGEQEQLQLPVRFHWPLGVTMVEYNVEAQIKVYVEDPAAMDSVKAGIEKIAKVQRFWEEDVGFGIKVLKATLLLVDAEGGMEKLEENIRSLDKVSQVEVESVSRV